jgi:hypothetical protein
MSRLRDYNNFNGNGTFADAGFQRRHLFQRADLEAGEA